MANVVTTFFARFVSFEHRDYKGFTDRDGRPVPGGTKHVLWVLPDDGGAPVEVGVHRDDAPTYVNFDKPEAFGTPIEVRATSFAQGNRVTFRLESLSVVAASKPRAVAG